MGRGPVLVNDPGGRTAREVAHYSRLLHSAYL